MMSQLSSCLSRYSLSVCLAFLRVQIPGVQIPNQSLEVPDKIQKSHPLVLPVPLPVMMRFCLQDPSKHFP